MNIRSLAEQAGVSVATVSRVLSNHPDVALATRQRILELMDEYQYVPTAIKNKATSIGLLYDKRAPLVDDAYRSGLLRGIMNIASASNITVVLIPLENAALQVVEFRHLLRASGVGGVICVVPPISAGLASNIVECHVPHVFLGDRIDIPGANWLSADHRSAGTDAAKYLMHLGHRTIGVINDENLGTPDRLDRIDGFIAEMRLHGLAVAPQFRVDAYADLAALQALLSGMMHCEPAPTAFFATSHNATLQTLFALKALGVQVPQTVSLLGFGDYLVTEYQQPSLTVIRQPLEELGHKAAIYLSRTVHQPNALAHPLQEVLPTSLIIRASTAAINNME